MERRAGGLHACLRVLCVMWEIVIDKRGIIGADTLNALVALCIRFAASYCGGSLYVSTVLFPQFECLFPVQFVVFWHVI